jgi:hypothetical protein
MLRRVQTAVGIVLATVALGGCDALSGRWGPNPAITPAEFTTVASNQRLVLDYLETMAGFVAPDGKPVLQLSPSGWAEVAQWGFNVGRQDCEIYMDTLFRINREKGRNDNILVGLGTAAAAIVTGTTAAQKPLSILAAVFGLSVVVNDAVFQTYLFTEAPGLVSKKVADLQDEFRNLVAGGKVVVNSPSTAFYAVQTYYSICLPHSIEGVLLQKVADAKPVTPVSPSTPSAPVAASARLRGAVRSPNSAPTTAIRRPELQ